jgi:hypothetical protein
MIHRNYALRGIGQHHCLGGMVDDLPVQGKLGRTSGADACVKTRPLQNKGE